MAVVKLYDICSKIGSGATPRGGKEVYCDEGISLIRSQNVLDYSFLIEGLVHINDVQADKLRNVIVEEDDVLLNITGDSVARVCVVDSTYLPARVNQHVCIIRANKKYVQGSYLLYFLQLNKQYLLQLAAGGATRNALTKDMIGNLELELPSLEQQKRVVSLLDDIQAKIKENKKINDNLYEIASTLFTHYLEHEKENVKYTTIDQVSDVKGGKRLPKGINLISEVNTHPYIRVRDLNNVIYVVQTSDFEYVDDETQKSIARYIVQMGDVLISIVGTIGLTAIVDKSLDSANLTENCVKLNNLRGICPEYLLLFLRSDEGQSEIIKGTVGAVQAKLPIKNIQSIHIPILSDKGMKQLKEKIQPIFTVIASNTAENINLSNLRDSLLPKLMSGELDTSDINI